MTTIRERAVSVKASAEFVTRIGIKGFGRMGRLALGATFSRPS